MALMSLLLYYEKRLFSASIVILSRSVALVELNAFSILCWKKSFGSHKSISGRPLHDQSQE